MSSLETSQNVEDSGLSDLKKEYSNPSGIIDELKIIDDEINNLARQTLKKKGEKDKLYKLLSKMTTKTSKDLEKIQAKKKSHNKGGGLSVPYDISDQLKEFLSLEDKKYSRGEITTILTEFIKENNLKNPENTKLLKFTKKSPIFKILKVNEESDEKLKHENKKLRNLNDEEMNNVKVFGGINKYIQHHFIKSS